MMRELAAQVEAEPDTIPATLDDQDQGSVAEKLCSSDSKRGIKSFHLAEGPGGFVEALWAWERCPDVDECALGSAPLSFLLFFVPFGPSTTVCLSVRRPRFGALPLTQRCRPSLSLFGLCGGGLRG